MLQDIRDNSQGVVTKVIIGLIIAVFALFGVESIIGGFTTTPPVAEVNGEEISEQQLEFSAQQLLSSLGGNLETLDQGLVRQIALNQLVEETVLRQSAENNNMLVSSDRIDRAIIETPAFQLNGVYDNELAIRTMNGQGYSPASYRQTLAQRMIMSQLANAYTGSDFVTEDELDRIVQLSEQRRSFRYLPITMGTRTLGTAISDEEINDYYEANQAAFMLDETVAVDYVVLDKNALFTEVELDDEAVRQQYELERSDFEGSAEKRASHILFEVSGDLSEEEALEQARAAKKRLDEGEDFGALALELSSDTGSAEDAGDIGYSDGTAFPEELEQALGELEVGEVSDPVSSDFGVHLVKLTEDNETVFESFEEAADRIARDLKASEVELTYAERLEDLSNLAFESADLSAIGEELKLEIQHSEHFSRSGTSGLFANPALLVEAFSDEVLLDGNNSNVIEVDSEKSVVLRVQDHREATIQPIEDVKSEIAVILRTEMEREAVQELGEEILASLREQGSAEELVADNELEWLQEENVDRNSPMVNREISNQAFAMTIPESATSQFSGISMSNGSYVIIELTEIIPGNLSSMEESERAALSGSIVNEKGSSEFQSVIANLRENADFKSNLEDEF